MSDRTVARRLAEMVVGFRLEDSPVSVERQARLALADTLGCILGGSHSPVVDKLVQALLWEGGASGSTTVPGLDVRLSPLGAAMVMGASAHAFEFDDGYTPGSAHPGSAVIPSVLAFAERQGLSLGSVLEALVAGYEVMLAVAETIHPESRRQGFHNTAVAGVFGAAAATSKLLRLDAVQTTSALGLAGSYAGGLLSFWNPGEVGATDVKKLHPGKAARDGAFCAICASRGIRGPASVFEGKAGFFRAYSGKEGHFGPQSQLSAQRLVTQPRIMDIYFKPWPCCRSLHGPIALALDLRKAGIRTNDIDSITVDTYSLAAERSRTEAEGDDAHFSIPLTVALALCRGEVTYHALAEAHREPLVGDLARKVLVRADEVLSAQYPRCRPARITLRFKTGATVSRELANPPGEPNAPLPEEHLREKFLGSAITVISEGSARLVLSLILSADSTQPIASIIAAMTRAPRKSPRGRRLGKGFRDD